MSLIDTIVKTIEAESPDSAAVFRREIGNADLPTINSYFRKKLTNAPVDTRDERGCLIDTLSVDQWLEYFRTIVLPKLIRFNLI